MRWTTRHTVIFFAAAVVDVVGWLAILAPHGSTAVGAGFMVVGNATILAVALVVR